MAWGMTVTLHKKRGSGLIYYSCKSCPFCKSVKNVLDLSHTVFLTFQSVILGRTATARRRHADNNVNHSARL